MTKTPTSKASNGKDESNSQVFETSDLQSSILLKSEQKDLRANREKGKEQANSYIENVRNKGDELVEVEIEASGGNSTKSGFQRLKAKTIGLLVSSAVMLPILAVGTATYYFGNRAIDKQAVLTRRSDNIGIAETELARQRRLLAALLIGTGTTALLAGAIAALGSKKLVDLMSQNSGLEAEKASTQAYKDLIDNLSQSISQQDILKAIVEEARSYLNCDRVVVYSLNKNKYGTIIAESVGINYTRWLGITIEDPCFEARYLDKYRDGRVRAIDDINKVELAPCYKEQLEAMEVKANLVTPIVYEGNLFGLLVAHQCDRSREWQKGEIEFLHQIAKKTGLALKNAQLLNDMVRLQDRAETERQWTNYFTDAIQYIRASIDRDDVLDISVEEVRRVLECDRVVVYSLNKDNNYGAVIAESVSAAYPRALNKTIEDPCFEARYLDKYRDGRVRAINNIYEAGMTKCYIEQLETLEVKANLVTPILNEGKLF
ncbi:MAG: GAF domain-containing protein, partial [Cyanobacteria bacterium P01_G01_bin.19]